MEREPPEWKVYFLVGKKRRFANSWHPKRPLFNDCFNWMIPNLYMENGCFTKHPFKTR